MEASSKISDEEYRLAAAELGIDFDSLQQKANQKEDDALTNLASILEQESAVLGRGGGEDLVGESWYGGWKEALCLDLDKLTLSPTSASEVPENLALSKLESLCLDLSNFFIDEGKNLQGLSKD